MKEFLNSLNFTKRSIIVVLVFLFFGALTVSLKCGYQDKYHIILSSVLISGMFILWLIYAIVVIMKYYRLPRNRERKKKMGVLFIINTHGNKKDYKAIVEKFIEKFEEYSTSIEVNILKPIILTEKKVSVLKNIDDKNVQKKLLIKTGCLFGVFIKATDIGQNSKKYQLTTNAMLVHPQLEPQMRKIFANNFCGVFNGLRLNLLDKENDLNKLQSLSTQLYYICQLIYGVANTYSGHYVAAMDLLTNLLSLIDRRRDSFCNQLKKILYGEIYVTIWLTISVQYRSYINHEKYDHNLVFKSLSKCKPLLKFLPNECTIEYHLHLAIYFLLIDEIVKSKNEINSLKSKFKKVRPNNRIWEYSDKFLIACENEPKAYKKIIEGYEYLKHNVHPANNIQAFIIRYLDDHLDNLGVKIALFCLTYNREDLDINVIPTSLKEEIINELIQLNLLEEAKYFQRIELTT